MAVFISNPGGGKKDLNLKIVGGTSQPSGAFGTVWVNTDTAITKYFFTAAEPLSPATGDIWFRMYSESLYSVDVSNNIKVNIIRVRQYISGAWVAKNAYAHDGTSWNQVSYAFNPSTDISYTGNYTVVDDGDGDWRVKFTTSGTLTFATTPGIIDAFIVGGGGGGGSGCNNGGGNSGGSGGYTRTEQPIFPEEDTGYPIVVGAGGVGETDGGSSSAFGVAVAGGGHGNDNNQPRPGGSGGGSNGNNDQTSGSGGSDGGNGTSGTTSYFPGIGQGFTTREFGEASGDLYAGGGGGAAWYGNPGAGGDGGGGAGNGVSGTVNTGGGGGAQKTTGTIGSGGSGIVVIRNHRITT